LKLKEPSAPLLASLTGIAIVPRGLEGNKDALQRAPMGTGPFKFEEWQPNGFIRLAKHAGYWNAAEVKLAGVKFNFVPEAATRANLLERGDADLSIDLQASDIDALEQRGRIKLVAVPQTNGFTGIVFNTRLAPFDNPKVRQAVAAALPYEDMFKAALFGRGRRLFGARWTEVPSEAFPQRLPLNTDLAKAKALLTEAGYPNGLQTTFAFAAGAASAAEPAAVLVKEALAKIGIEVTVQKMPDAQFVTLQVERRLPLFMESGTAWLPAPDYFLRTYFSGEHRWNFSGFKNAEMDSLVQAARFETDPAKYAAACKRMITIAATDVPTVMLWQPNQDAVMARNISGYTYWFHRQVDYRDLVRA